MTAIAIADARFSFLVGSEYALICDTIMKHKSDPKAMYEAMDTMCSGRELPMCDDEDAADELYFVDHIIAILGYRVDKI